LGSPIQNIMRCARDPRYKPRASNIYSVRAEHTGRPEEHFGYHQALDAVTYSSLVARLNSLLPKTNQLKIIYINYQLFIK
jgi:hypothetical protein